MTLVCHEAVVLHGDEVFVTDVFVPEGPFAEERSRTVTRILVRLLPGDYDESVEG